MIRINLLAVERERTKKKAGFQLGQKLTIGCSLVLVLGSLFIGWRYWSLGRESAQVDREIAAAQEEAGRLHTIIEQVQQFEQRKAQLQQRVELIEQLRRGQNGPVHMLDQISRSLPDMLWLTELKQNSATEVLIDGKCLSLTSLSDFVANLEGSGYFKKSIEIVSSTTESMSQPPGEMIRFSIKALFQPPADTAPPAAVKQVG
jgi:type IV pilus assembly protein PilN